jgi:hypothetical protein
LSLFPQYKYTTKEQLIKANNELTGYETNLKSGDDLNNIKTPGNYRINGSGLGGLLLNYPTGFNGKLKVEYIQNNTYILQTVTARDNHIWTRVYDPTGSGWSVWKPLTPDDDTGWIALTLSGTFSSAGAGNTGVYYRKIGNRVRWKGNISNSAWTSGAWVTLTTLPVGVRPLQDLYFTTGSNANNMVTINVTSTGAVSLWAASATNFNVGLNMIQFDLD